jgi:hypothetical protein
MGCDMCILEQGRLVHYAIVPLAPDGGFEGNKHVLNTIVPPVKWDEDIEVRFQHLCA